MCEQASDFVLKVCGKEEYLLGDRTLVNFCYIQDTLARDVVPTLIAVPKSSIPGQFRNKNYVHAKYNK